MSRWKMPLLALVVLVPLLAYVGSVLTTGADLPARPEPVILQEQGTDADVQQQTRPEPRRKPRGKRGQTTRPSPPPTDDVPAEETDEMRVVVPSPTQVDDDDDDDRGDEDDDDDGDDDRDDD